MSLFSHDDYGDDHDKPPLKRGILELNNPNERQVIECELGNHIPPLPEALVNESRKTGRNYRDAMRYAAKWAANEQFRICVDWLANKAGMHNTAKLMVLELRPKPLSLKQQALNALDAAKPCGGFEGCKFYGSEKDVELIRRAVEALSDD
jgi:hypothetical protein